MNPYDLLSTVLFVAILIMLGCILFITFFLVKALRSVIGLIDNLEETTRGIKDKVQLRVLAAIPAILIALASKILKKGR